MLILLQRCHFCTKVLPKLSKIPSKFKNIAVTQAQQVLTDYFHATRCIPYAYADRIASNSHSSISDLVSKVGFSADSVPNFSKSLNKFLRYNPINEFEFFFESIGINYTKVADLLPPNKFFFSEDGSLLDAASVLYEFGFPWEKLGLLYVEGGCVFRFSPDEVKGRLCGLKRHGFCSEQVVGICLAFPFVFHKEGVSGVEIHRLLADLKFIFLDFDLAGSVEGNVDSWHEVCRKIRVFYDLIGEKGKMGELIGRNKNVILENGKENLIQKAEYFCRFCVKKEEVARLMLQGSELLSLNLEKPVINVLKLLKHFGMSSKDLEDVRQNYAHVLGTVKMANLPNVMRALDLHEWFIDKIKDGNHQLLVNYVTSYPNEHQDKGYQGGLKAIRDSRTPVHNMNKLNFLHSIGFGENALTMTVLNDLHGTSCVLHERYGCLLDSGIEFSKLCKMIRIRPQILSQKPEIIGEKINYVCQEMGSLEFLFHFPAFLCFDLERRIRPRYRFHKWIKEKGLCPRNYSVASMIATSDKNFVPRVFRMHPAAPKHWFEQFYLRKLPV